MPILRSVAAALGFATRDAAAAAPAPAPSAGIIPPSRDRLPRAVTAESAVTLSTVYRAFQIITTSAAQISYHPYRAGQRLPEAQVASLLKRPCLDMTRTEFVEYTITSMVATGDAFWLKNFGPDGYSVLDVTPLNPHEVTVNRDPKTRKTVYGYRGKTYTGADIVQVSLLRLPGHLTGLGPIQAAQTEIAGALDLRDYSANWFAEGTVPDGILSSDQVLTPEDAKLYREQWTKSTGNPTADRLKVLGKGTTYEALMLKPADAQWLESQQFTTTQLARLFGTPASLMLAAVEGSAMTYSNVEQDWIAFTRFTLMGYLRKIEDALTELTPRGQDVKFNVDSLLRSDTKTRYEAHQIGITAGFLTDDEARALENLPPLTPEQRAAKAAAPAPAPAESDAA